MNLIHSFDLRIGTSSCPMRIEPQELFTFNPSFLTASNSSGTEYDTAPRSGARVCSQMGTSVAAHQRAVVATIDLERWRNRQPMVACMWCTGFQGESLRPLFWSKHQPLSVTHWNAHSLRQMAHACGERRSIDGASCCVTISLWPRAVCLADPCLATHPKRASWRRRVRHLPFFQ